MKFTPPDGLGLRSVNVFADDTDILIMLLHHIPQVVYSIFLTSGGKIYDVLTFSRTLDSKEMKCLLMIFAFSGCDTVSGIFRLSKTKCFKKMSGTKGPTDLVEVFVERRPTSDEIKVAGLKVLEFLY